MKRRHKILSLSLGATLLVLGSVFLTLSHDAPCQPGPALAAGTTMQAMVYRCYGPPEVVKLEAVPKPTAAPDRLVIKVHAASVNPLDWHYLRGKPYWMRALGVGWWAPEDIRLGVDFAGQVEAVGSRVTRFKPGDAVFGGADGAFAEYVTAREGGSLTMKPDAVSYTQAAAVPIAAVTALQALRDKGNLQPGQQVLINGASGGVGTFAVQIARAMGGEVTAVCSTRNLPLVRSIGANHVIDYTREDFTRGAARYDLIIDTVATHSLGDYRRVLTPHGALVMVGGQDNGPWMMDTLLRSAQALVMSPFIDQRFLFLLADLNQADLTYLGGLMQAGKITSVIDRAYALKEVPAALRYVEQGHARGKVVIGIE